MRIIRASARNFASYENLEFDFTNKGLTLISGPTGAGKSTLCDLVPWILFGKTAKGGAVDEVRSWNIPNMGTVGILYIDSIRVVRTRFPNDLCFEKDGVYIRGATITDTQKLLNTELGLDYDTYLAGAYFHEFSQTAQFFTAPAKVRRSIIEEMVDLNLAITLTESLSQYKKDLKAELTERIQTLTQAAAILDTLEFQKTRTTQRSETWTSQNATEVLKLEHEQRNADIAIQDQLEEVEVAFIREEMTLLSDIEHYEEAIKISAESLGKIQGIDEKIADLKAGKCKECGNQLHSDEIIRLTKQINHRDALTAKLNMAEIQVKATNQRLDAARKRKDAAVATIHGTTTDYAGKIADLSTAVNPYAAALSDLELDITKTTAEKKEAQRDADTAKVEISDVELLLSLVDELRVKCVKATIVELQTRTNNYLTQFFDAEIKVSFSAEGADKIEVEIYKDGNNCVYTQLSKGQRQMLKLSFGVSVMQSIGNRFSGFNALFFDEALDGLSEELKAKAYRLFQQLSTIVESVFVVEHSESLKSLFENKIEVSLVDGNSQIA